MLIQFEFNTADTVEISSNIQLNLPRGYENRLGGGSYGTIYKVAGIVKRNGTTEVWRPNPFQRLEADRTGHQPRNEGHTRYWEPRLEYS